MADYMNPTAGLPSQDMPNNPFWGGVNQGMNNQIMQPFRANALSQQDLALQEARAKFSEFSSPEAANARRQKLLAGTATDLATQQTAPAQAQYDAAKAIAMHKSLPEEEQMRMQTLKQKLDATEGTAAAKVFNDLADSAVQLDKVPENMRPAAYEQIIAQVRAQNPGQKIPDRFSSYNPEGVRDLQLGFMARLESVGQKQALAIQAAKDQATKETQVAKNASDERQAKYTADAAAGASRYGANKRAETERGQTPGVAFAKMQGILRSPVKLEAYAKENGLSKTEAKEAIQHDVDDYRFQGAMKIANAEVMANQLAIMQGKDTSEAVIQRSLARQGIGGKTPSQKASTVAEYKKQYPQYANIPDDKIRAAYKQKTGEDLK